MVVVKNCMLCGKKGQLEISGEAEKMYKVYMSGRCYIQDIPLSADQREFLKTGMCPECQHMMFDEEEEE